MSADSVQVTSQASIAACTAVLHRERGIGEMSTRTALRAVIMMCAMLCVLVSAVVAAGQDNLQKYFSDTACKVKGTADPSEKRAILSERLQDMSTALDKVESSTLISEADRAGLDSFKATIEERQSELAGTDGYDRVPDAQLNAFSDFVVQDGEQADRTITISLVVLLLIIIILILIL
jgi:septal ring factor EnvC (AmiA/AmiB activator)